MYNISRESDFIKIAAGDSFVRYVSAKEFLGMIVTSAGKISFRCPTFIKENVAMSDVIVEGNPYTNDADFISLLEQLGSNDGGMFSNSYIKRLVEFESGSKVISIEPLRFILNVDNEYQFTAEDDFTYYYGKLLVAAGNAFDLYDSLADFSANTNPLYVVADTVPASYDVLIAAAALSGEPSEGLQNGVFTGYKIKVQPYASMDFLTFDEAPSITGVITLSGQTDIIIDWGDTTFTKYSGDEDTTISFNHNYDSPGGFVFKIKILSAHLENIIGIENSGDENTNGALNSIDFGGLKNIVEINLATNAILPDRIIKLFNNLDANGAINGNADLSGQDADPIDVPDSAANLTGKGWTLEYDS